MRDVWLSAVPGEVATARGMAGGAIATSNGVPAGGSSKPQLTATGAGGAATGARGMIDSPGVVERSAPTPGLSLEKPSQGRHVCLGDVALDGKTRRCERSQPVVIRRLRHALAQVDGREHGLLV